MWWTGWGRARPILTLMSHVSCLPEGGGLHKVLLSNNQSFVIAAYQPFPWRAHVLGATLHPSSVSGHAHALTRRAGY